ncbi:hypothetical protein L9F63_006146 [Diploptera punctata]|uniref:Uncharacterized protein n=1 Tax=Diploptera punctata TaxID=6984 RepID=A0AAD7ZBU5_DIPPU|nr:hypothetical protein L9F63_006146 [Diploptera punctata]
MEHLLNWCLTVDIQVKTNRDSHQEEALHQVNSLIDELVIDLNEDPVATRTRCIAYMDACSSQSHGAIDETFENVILGARSMIRRELKRGYKDYCVILTRCYNKVHLLQEPFKAK